MKVGDTWVERGNHDSTGMCLPFMGGEDFAYPSAICQTLVQVAVHQIELLPERVARMILVKLIKEAARLHRKPFTTSIPFSTNLGGVWASL
jgi:hypothetical protein